MLKRMRSVLGLIALAIIIIVPSALHSASAAPLGTNIALNKPIEASSDNGYKATNANNGKADFVSRWEATVFPATLTVDLGTTYKISKTVVKLPYDGTSMTFSVQGSIDKTVFTDIVPSKSYAFSTASSDQSITFSPTDARYVRLNFTAATFNRARVAEFEVYADSDAPDLVVTDILTSPAQPKQGDLVTFSAVVKNQGNAATIAGVGHRVSFQTGGKELATSAAYTSSIAPGQSVTIPASGTWTAAAFSLPVTAMADADGTLGESDETNNSFTKTITVGGKIWSNSWTITDYMGIYDFPEELISYLITPPAGTVKKENLKLTQYGANDPLVYQLSNVKESNGYLTSATISFRTSLKKYESKSFTVDYDPSYKLSATPIAISNNKDFTTVITANKQQIQVPTGKTTYNNALLSQVKAPLLAMGRSSGVLLGGGTLSGPSTITVSSVTGTVVEQGPLFVTYKVSYALSGSRTYEMTLTVKQNEQHVTVDEKMSGLKVADNVFFRFSYKNGVDPDGRLAMQNGGYLLASASQKNNSGEYGINPVDSTGKLQYQLGIYQPNSGSVDKATVFWKDSGDNAIIFSVRDLQDWKTSSRYYYFTSDKPENLYFYNTSDDKYMQTELVGTERHWALGIIPRSEAVIEGIKPADYAAAAKGQPVTRTSVMLTKTLSGYPTDSNSQFGAGPEVRLTEKLNDFSLDHYKDMVFDFTENVHQKLKIPPSAYADTTVTKQQWEDEHVNRYLLLSERYWDMSSSLGANHFGWYQEAMAEEYANSRENWSESDRKRARAILVFTAYLMEDDNAMPHTSMLGGQPNFTVAYKQGLGIMPAVFPSHPDAARWKNAYLTMWHEFLDKYVRKDNSSLNLSGGRFFENISTYNYASMESAYNAAYSLQQYDGTNVLADPTFYEWLDWNMNALMPNAEGTQRIVPPQGAHSWKELLMPGGRWYNVLYSSAQLVKPSNPTLANGLLWEMTGGKEGVDPNLESKLYTDYGAILRYDAGGPNEAYVNIQQLNGNNNYRWGGVSANGVIYYSSKGKTWSWNGGEENGDYLDIDNLSLAKACSNCGYGLHGSSMGNVLYNFDFAQYYRADTSATSDARLTGYLSRGIMMLRDDYLSIYDDRNNKADTLFNWANRETGLTTEYFNNVDFTSLKSISVSRDRFPVGYNWSTGSPVAGVDPDTFSVRWTGEVKVPTSESYTFSFVTPATDRAKVWVGGVLVADSQGSSTPISLNKNQYYDIKVEYVHNTGSANIAMRWQSASTALGTIDRSWFFRELPQPNIYTPKDGPGDELHIVAPEPQAVASTSWGAIVGGKEFVIQSDTAQTVSQAITTASGPINVGFTGTTGYAGPQGIAIFDGTKANYGDLALERSGGDFGVSAQLVSSNQIQGRFAGKSGGNVTVTLPQGMSSDLAVVVVDGKIVPAQVSGNKLTFTVSIQQSDGYKSYCVNILTCCVEKK
ncbi:PA14 domain-containing protein [Gorillibacterium massiliense]|uniref:PA14 domain-containing protein n=1 Tax=Gorillibacterium massiliense TaxID=1280390 RepID=UPI0004B98381|nr:PA14 domain-containing protein [Gorillibacterium massiliense]